MALELKFKLELNANGETIFLTDTTGEFDLTDNQTGWGGINPQLGNSALAVLVQRTDEEGITILDPVAEDVVAISGADNSDVITFEMILGKDGHHKCFMFALYTSADGSAIIGGGGTVLQEGDFFYWTNQLGVYKIISGSPVLVEDFTDMIDGQVIDQAFCQQMFYVDLTQEKHSLYREYKDPRNKRFNDDDTFRQLQDLGASIQGAEFAFRSGLTTEAENIVDTLLNEYEL